MALDINGYNDAFKAFADFAERRMGANDSKAIARTSMDAATGSLDGRSITAADTDSVRGLFKWSRSADNKAANDVTRRIFKDAIIDIFGGESKIPASVKKAMLLSDYDCGKPLTARRILAVKTAIDKDGTAAKISLETFTSPDVKAAALELGFSNGELPRLARTAHLLSQATGMPEMEAMREVAESGSKANRLMQYGGRFLDNSANFANGLRLIDSFATWFAETKAALDAAGSNLQTGMSKTVLNGNKLFFTADCLRGMEKFVFEEFSCNPAYDLAETDPEKLFGMGGNAAMRCFGRGLGEANTQTIANIPPAKRAVFYAAMDKAFPLLVDPDMALLPDDQLQAQGSQGVAYPNKGFVVGRIMKNFDKLQSLLDKGSLTTTSFLKTCFPEVRGSSIAGVDGLVARWGADMTGDYRHGIVPKYSPLLVGPMQLLMQETGCSIDEAFAAVQGGNRPPIPRYVATGTLPLAAFDGTTREARAQLGRDLYRPANYKIGGQWLLHGDSGFRFNFPDGSCCETNGTAEGRAQIATVVDKVEALCGGVHREQASSVLMMLSQSGLGALRGGLEGYGITSDEHSAVDYTLSKDAETGTVTIKYSSPVELPFRFEWTASVDAFGNITSKPMKFEKPVARLDNNAAGVIVDAAAKKLGTKLTGAQKREAVRLLQTHATNMYLANAKLLAGFVVNLAKSSYYDGDAKAAMMEEMAASIREWRSFGFGDKGMVQVANAAKDYANSCISDYMRPERDNKFVDSIYTSMRADSNRATYILNGRAYVKRPADEMLHAFKDLVPDPKKQRAISSWLNQICMSTFSIPATRNPYDNGVEAHKLPGGGSIVNRSFGELFYDQVFDANKGHLVHDLQVSPDGKTATVTQSMTTDLCGPRLDRDTATTFGQVTLSMRLVIDLEAETPTVTDFQLSQTLV